MRRVLNFKAKKGYAYIGDETPNIEVGLSMYKLYNNYTGNCIKVRRSLDNATQDVGFIDNELDTVSLLNFVGVSDGYIHTWYDQSGNNNNFTQTSTLYQPKISSLGSIYERGGKYTSIFINSKISSTHVMNGSFTISAVANRRLDKVGNTILSTVRWGSIPDNNYGFSLDFGNLVMRSKGGSEQAATNFPLENKLKILSSRNNAGFCEVFNNEIVGQNTANGFETDFSNNTSSLGGVGSDRLFDGEISQLIVCNSSLSDIQLQKLITNSKSNFNI